MFKSILTTLFFVFTSLSSFAQWTDYNQGPQMLCPTTGRWQPPGTCPPAGYGQQQMVIGQQQQQCPGQLIQTQFGLQCRIPQGSQFANQALQGGVGGLTRCQVVGAGLGALIASFAHNHRNQAIVGGALLGGLVGDVICTPQPQQMVVQQQPVQQALPYQPQQQFPQQPPRSAMTCHVAGTVPAVVTEQGHHQFGKTVCASPNDPNVRVLN